MFLVQQRGGSVREPGEVSIAQRIAHLRPKARWATLSHPRYELAYAPGAGCGPVVASTSAGDFLLAFGTPSRPGTGLVPSEATVRGWLDEYLRGDLTALSDCEGLYVFVGYRTDPGQLDVLIDRSGMVPCYALEHDTGVTVSASALAIGCLHRVTLSEDFWACLTHVGYPLGSVSPFNEVRRLDAGEHWRAGPDGVVQQRWWRPACDQLRTESAEVLGREMADHLLATLRSRMASENEVVAAMTGGFDSRCICALTELLDRPHRFFTGDVTEPEDAQRTAALAEQFDLPWSVYRPPPISADEWRELFETATYLCNGEKQPFSEYVQWAHALGPSGAVLLFGFSGEILNDYWSKQEKVRFLLRGDSWEERLMIYRMKGSLPHSVVAPDSLEGARERVKALLRQSCESLPPVPLYDRLDALYPRERVRRWASVHMHAISWYAKCDASLIGQYGFDLCYRLPRAAKADREVFRWALWNLRPDLAAVPFNQGYGMLPRRIASRRARVNDLWLNIRKLAPKVLHRFGKPRPVEADDAHWQDRPTYRALFEDVLDPARMQSASLYDQAALRGVLDDCLDNRVQKALPINPILSLELALRATTRFDR